MSCVPAGLPSHRGFADDDDVGAPRFQVPAQSRLVARFVKIDGVLHIIPGWIVRELADWAGGRASRNLFAGHNILSRAWGGSEKVGIL